jgi:hypothetical protein
MNSRDEDLEVDLSVSPERMIQIRDGVRESLVQQIHALRITARAFRKAGIHDHARQCEREAGRLARAVSCLDNPMSMLTFRPEDNGQRSDRS